jgi:excisionase family DNA binding protein
MLSRAADIVAELAALAARQAELTAELAEAMRAAPVPAPLPVAGDAPEYLTTDEAAALLGVSASHLKALRAEGRGPHHVRVGRAVRYPRAALMLRSTATNGGDR